MTADGPPVARCARDVMSTWLVVVEAEDDAAVAWEAMGGAGVHHLPVMDAGRLVAVLAEHDLLLDHARWSLLPRRRRVRDLLTRPLVQVGPEHTLAQVAQTMTSEGSDVVVVTGTGGELLGLVTARDLVDALAGHQRLRRADTSADTAPPVLLRVAPGPRGGR